MRHPTLYYKIGFVIPLECSALLGNSRRTCRTHVSYPALEARVLLAGSVIGHGCSWEMLIAQHAQPDIRVDSPCTPTYTNKHVNKIGFVLDDFAHLEANASVLSTFDAG